MPLLRLVDDQQLRDDFGLGIFSLSWPLRVYIEEVASIIHGEVWLS